MTVSTAHPPSFFGPPAAGPVCDCHLHIYDPAFPYEPDAALRPPPATAATYQAVRDAQGVRRSVIVQPTTYGYDNRCTLDAVARLGMENARAVAVVPATVSDEELFRLDQGGCRGVRINALRGALLDTEAAGALARRIAPLGWHLQLHVAGAALPALSPWLRALPVPVVLDHMGRLNPAQDPESPPWRALRDLLNEAQIWVKLSAPYLLDPDGAPGYRALAPLAEILLETAPQRLLWGSDWPHPGWHAQGRPRLDEAALHDWAWRHLDRHGIARKVLIDNPARLYGFTDAPGGSPAGA